MTTKIPISAIGEYMEDEVDRLLRAVVLQTDRLVKKASPVDTGRFAVSWMIGKDDQNGKPKKPGNYGKQITPPKGSNYLPGTETVGSAYYVHNNLPYAEPVALGTNLPPSWGGKYRSKGNQVTAGWFQLVAKDMEDITKQFWNDIKGTT